MIRSMTGYGRGEVTAAGVTWTVEVRSVNHRFLEISANLPRHLWALEERLRGLIKSRLARGRVEVQLNWEGRPEKPVTLIWDRAQTEELVGVLARMGALLPEPEPVRLSHLLPFADLILTRERPAQDVEELWRILAPALAQALAALEGMRTREGAALAQESRKLLQDLIRKIDQIKAQAEELPRLWQEKLRARLQELLGEGAEVDETRLAQEVALLAERRDIQEELARLDSHVAQFLEALSGSGPVGRKLDFLLQEMWRETNTIGAKAADLEISQAVVAMKLLLERLREQVQNLE